MTLKFFFLILRLYTLLWYTVHVYTPVSKIMNKRYNLYCTLIFILFPSYFTLCCTNEICVF